MFEILYFTSLLNSYGTSPFPFHKVWITDAKTDRNLKYICVMRVWKENCGIPICGALIVTLTYHFTDTYE